MIDDGITRRSVLRSVAAAGTATVATGMAAGQEGPTDRIVGTASPEAVRAARAQAESVKRVLDFGDIGKAVAGRFTDEAAENLRQRPDVRYIEIDGQWEALEIDSEDSEVPWGVDRVDAEKVHSSETGGDDTEDGAHIAIIDTGIDDDHPDLQANVGAGRAYVRCKGPNCNYDWSDDNDHGTHCAGIADAVDNSEGVVGVSTEATLHAVKVLDRDGSGYWSDVAAGIEYVADQGWDVGSLSLGGSSGSSTVRDACQYAYSNGVLLVAAAGNDGPCSDCVGYPAAYSDVIAVSSTNKNDNLSGFSSTGPEVELAAPGSKVYSTVIGGYDMFSGTSMACPHVSGAGGQLMDNGYSNTEARDQLKSAAEDIGLSSNEQGNGLLDVEAAVSDSSDPSPTVDSLSANEVETTNGDAEFDVSWSVSDDEDDLSSVDLALTDDTAGETEDTASVSVSGSSASGTTRLVAAGDEGTGNSYTVDLTVTDSNSNSSSDSTTVTESEDAPTVDSLSASEVETSNGDAEFDVSWDVSDADGDLSTLELTLIQDSDGSTEDSKSPSVSGSSASGTTRLVASGDDGSGNSYTVSATVTDTDGTSGSGSMTVSESEDTNSVPSASIDTLTDNSNPQWDRYEVDWSASDEDGNLDTVVVEMLDSSGTVLDSVENNVSGSSASGTNEVRSKQTAAEIVVTATDTDGESESDSQST